MNVCCARRRGQSRRVLKMEYVLRFLIRWGRPLSSSPPCLWVHHCPCPGLSNPQGSWVREWCPCEGGWPVIVQPVKTRRADLGNYTNAATSRPNFPACEQHGKSSAFPSFEPDRSLMIFNRSYSSLPNVVSVGSVSKIAVHSHLQEICCSFFHVCQCSDSKEIN